MKTKDDTMTSRRQFVSGVTAGLAAALTTPAFAQQGAAASSSRADTPGRRGQSSKQDPTTQYRRPPFPPQQQDPPGLAGKMDPRPDHGETSYRGSGKLVGRKALVTGGDSGIGRAAVIAFAREGADVAINYLPVEEPDAREVVELVRAEGRKAVAIPGDIRDERFCVKLVADAVRELGGLDILVNNAATQVAQHSIEELTTEQFDSTFKTNVYAMFWITKAAMPHLEPGSAIINTSSVQAYDPSPDAAGLCADESVHGDLHQIAGQAGRKAGHSGKCGGAGAVLDAFATDRRPTSRKTSRLRGTHAHGAPWPARGTGRPVCAPCIAGCQLCDGTSLRGVRRGGESLACCPEVASAGGRSSPAGNSVCRLSRTVEAG